MQRNSLTKLFVWLLQLALSAAARPHTFGSSPPGASSAAKIRGPIRQVPHVVLELLVSFLFVAASATLFVAVAANRRLGQSVLLREITRRSPLPALSALLGLALFALSLLVGFQPLVDGELQFFPRV